MDGSIQPSHIVHTLQADIAAIQAISSVPTILEAVAAMTGLRFVCIARVTEDSWTTCAVLDRLGFGLKVGDGLDVATTLCEEVRDTRKAVVIDKVSDDPVYKDHHTPRIYGFQSYISIPVFRPGGEYFGTLCALDPQEAQLSNTATVASMTLFAQLISSHLEAGLRLSATREALLSERETAELREQFIAVLGHDLRTPLSSIVNGIEVLQFETLSPRGAAVLQRMRRSVSRITGLVDDVLDFTRGRMGGGVQLNRSAESALGQALEQVVAELRGAHPQREIRSAFELPAVVHCDLGRIQQLLSNLLKNALLHGDQEQPVEVRASTCERGFDLTVSNAGPAIPEETMAHLFKPFWRGGPRAHSEGLGLGLFIASDIARGHDGVLSVASDDERTIFTFHMPQHGADMAA